MLQVIIAGRATKDGVLRYTADGTAVLGFSVVTDVGYGEKKHPVFVGCSLWGNRAEALDPYIKKGTSMTVIGEGDLRKWKTETSSGSEITIKVQELTLQGSKPANQEQAPAAGFRGKPAGEAVPQQADFDDDDIPF